MTDEPLPALQRWRDQQFADLFTLAIGLAVETHPEIVRQSLAKVFDLTYFEDATKRLMLVLAEVQQGIADIRIDLHDLRQEMDAMRVYQDAASAGVRLYLKAGRLMGNGKIPPALHERIRQVKPVLTRLLKR